MGLVWSHDHLWLEEGIPPVQNISFVITLAYSNVVFVALTGILIAFR